MSTKVSVGFAVILKEDLMKHSDKSAEEMLQQNLGLLVSFLGETEEETTCLVATHDTKYLCRLDRLIPLCAIPKDAIAETVEETLSKNYSIILAAAIKEIYMLRQDIDGLNEGVLKRVML